MNKKILLIYTGGTIGMIKDRIKDTLIPFNFNKIQDIIPEFKTEHIQLYNVSIKKPIDSSNMTPEYWIEIVQLIECNYDKYDSFVVLHGTDTMAYTASALSFMLENLKKAVIFTGSQIPIGERRTDAKENLITSVEIAASGRINEVCIYFEDHLYRGNRTVKVNTENFEAFCSPNYPILAEVGINIKYKNAPQEIKAPFKAHNYMSDDVAILKLFPGVKSSAVKAVIDSATGIIIESFGSGNASTCSKLSDILAQANEKGKILVNTTQCLYGSALLGGYETSEPFRKSGVICGKDITTEAAVTKLMFLLAKDYSNKEIKTELQKNLRGEISD